MPETSRQLKNWVGKVHRWTVETMQTCGDHEDLPRPLGSAHPERLPVHQDTLMGTLKWEECMPWRASPQLQANFALILRETKLGPNCGDWGVSCGLLTNAWMSQSLLSLWEGKLAAAQCAFGSRGPCFRALEMRWKEISPLDCTGVPRCWSTWRVQGWPLIPASWWGRRWSSRSR